jgi:acyl-CoA thioesterase
MEKDQYSWKEQETLFTGPHQFTMGDWISCAPFERLLHMEIMEAGEGRAMLTMPFLLDFAQGGGLMHGGALVSLADTAMAMAVKSILPVGTHFATVSMETKFLAPFTKGIAVARAEVTGRQDRIVHGRAVVYNEEERRVMEFSSVFKIARDSMIRGVKFKGV